MPQQEEKRAGYILLVEDDRGTCELEAQRLEPLGLQVRKAYSAGEARAALAEGAPAMMLLDYSLPDADALEFIAGLKNSGGEPPPFMLVTGRGDETVAVAAMKAGACDYLVKDGFFLERLPAATLKAIKDSGIKAALRASEERFKTLFDCGNDALFLYPLSEDGLPGRFVEVNREACARLGYTREEMLALTPVDIDAGGMSEARKTALERLTSEKAAVFEVSHRARDGRLIPVEVSARVLEYNGGPHVLSVARDLTERKRVEAERALLNEAITASLNEIYLFEEKPYKFRFLNHGALLNTGYTLEEALKLSPLDLKPEVKPEELEAILAPLRSGEKKLQVFEVRHRRKDGTSYQAEVHLQYIREHGVFLAVINDISERRQAEEKLHRQSALLEMAGRAASFGGWSVDLAAGICTWSDEVSAIHEEPPGYSPKLEDGIAYYAPEWRQKISEVFSACASEGLPYDEEMEIITAKGRRRWVRTIGRAERDGSGKIVRVAGAFQNISAEKQAEAALRASEATFRRLVEHSPDGIFLQLDGKFEYLNPEALRLFGAGSEKELQGKSIYEVFKEDFHGVIAARIKQLTLDQKRVPEIEEACVRRDGSEFPALVSAVPFEKDGRRGAIVTIRDVTAKKIMEEEILRSQKIESLGVLAGGIAHDFNNMLMGITANLSLLAARNPGSADLLEDALGAARSAQGLTAQLLSFARGGQPVKKETCIERTLKEIYNLSTSGTNVRQDLDIYERLWSVNADENQLKQAVNNLLINAVQAMPGGGTLALKAENLDCSGADELPLKPGKYILITVSDTGIGIPGKYLQRLFEPYFTTKPKGHGLGLAMTWNVVKSHGGHITAESSPGKGTTFRVYLPSSGRCLRDEQPPAPSRIARGSGRMLLLEDEEIVVRAARRMLGELGYACEVTGDGAETLRRYAAEKAAGTPFDAVIMDLTIPGGMGGRETGGELRRLHPEAVIIVSSGYSDEPVMADYKAFGFDAVLPKPYDYERLGQTLDRLLKRGQGE